MQNFRGLRRHRYACSGQIASLAHKRFVLFFVFFRHAHAQIVYMDTPHAQYVIRPIRRSGRGIEPFWGLEILNLTPFIPKKRIHLDF